MTLRERLSTSEGLVRLAGAHNAMGAKLAAAAGFEGVWASGFEIATAAGVRDSDALGWQELLPEAARMAAAVDVPVVADCGTGFGDCHALGEIARAYENVGVAGICMEDGASPRRNSLLPGEHGVACAKEFAGKIAAAAAARHEMVVIARLQSLVAGRGQAEACRRAQAYADAGADALVVHSRSDWPREVLEFIAAWNRPIPLVLIPTTYHNVTQQELAATGKVRMVIYANHGLRAAIAAMRRVFRQILDEGTSHRAETWIASLEDAFALQSPHVGDAP